jgi:hypothetical protein
MKGLRTIPYRSYIVAGVTLSACLLLPQIALAQAGGSYPPQSGATTAGGSYTPNPRAVSLYNLGLTAHKQGSPESAIIFFKRACDIDPNLADAQYNLGVLYQMQKRYKEAIPRFEEVLRIKPIDPDAHYQLGVILADAGRGAEARQHLSAIAPNNVHFADAQKRLAQLNSMPAQTTALDPGSGVPAQPTYQQPVQQVQQAAPLRDPGYATADSSVGTAGTTPAYGQLPQGSDPMAVQQAPVQQPVAQAQVVQQVPQQPAASSLPATAYIPPQASAPPPASTGPVPVLANSTLRIIATGFSAPSGLAFDRNGSLYVANYMTNSIDRIGPDGTRNTFCTGVNLRGPIGLVVDDSNNLYVANYNSGTVVRVSPAGISSVIASGFKQPYYLTLDKDGNLYVSQQADNSIVRIVLPRALGARAQ